MLNHSVAFGIVGIPVLVITGYSALDTPARDKASLRAKTTTIRIRIHRSKRTYSFTFFPNMADTLTQAAVGVLASSPRSLYDTVEADVFCDKRFHSILPSCEKGAATVRLSEPATLVPANGLRFSRRAGAAIAAKRGRSASTRVSPSLPTSLL